MGVCQIDDHCFSVNGYWDALFLLRGCAEEYEIGGRAMMNVDVKAGSDGTTIVRVTQTITTHRGWKYCKYIFDLSRQEFDMNSAVNNNHVVMPIKNTK